MVSCMASAAFLTEVLSLTRDMRWPWSGVLAIGRNLILAGDNITKYHGNFQQTSNKKCKKDSLTKATRPFISML